MLKREFVDLRSDTVTLPTEEMLEAIRHAKLGDDVYGEDPTVNELEALAAERMGKEAAVLVPSGTMANLVSLMSNTKRGDLVILESEAHMYWYEVGGISAVAGLLPWPVKSKAGALNPVDIEASIRPRNLHFPEPALVCIENTHNRHGGTVVSPAQLRELDEVAKSHGLRFYMDGARIFNAAVALGVDVKEFTKHVDNLMFCLSKGLSCPVGSLVVGSCDFVERARKNRKVLGGGMRQAGLIAAAGIVALDTMVDRLTDDHSNARFLAEGCARIDGLSVDLARVQTNMVILDIRGLIAEDAVFTSALKEKGILAGAIGKGKVRLVTHRGIEREHAERALNAIKDVVAEFHGR
ncbi:MAG TPA: low-specificity L-threonine aldolase [Candidatus Bathyarchaeia archaeon]|nr:low-specificity L-threonine aldolase [Candidatus Bathyarchaeia archaeon]